MIVPESRYLYPSLYLHNMSIIFFLKQPLVYLLTKHAESLSNGNSNKLRVPNYLQSKFRVI